MFHQFICDGHNTVRQKWLNHKQKSDILFTTHITFCLNQPTNPTATNKQHDYKYLLSCSSQHSSLHARQSRRAECSSVPVHSLWWGECRCCGDGTCGWLAACPGAGHSEQTHSQHHSTVKMGSTLCSSLIPMFLSLTFPQLDASSTPCLFNMYQ